LIFFLVLVELCSAALASFSEIPTSLLLIHLNFFASYPNLFVPPLLILLQNSRKVASLEGLLFYYGWLSSSADFTGGEGLFWLCGAGGGGGGTALEEMEMDAVVPWNASSSSRVF
jgi:hypothetical protein